jgi:hypothetical protein
VRVPDAPWPSYMTPLSFHRSSQPPSSYFSVSRPSDAGCRSSSHLSGWAFSSTSSVPSSRRILRTSTPPAPLLHLVRWLAFSTSTCASTRGAGALYRGSTSPTSSLPAHGITVCRRPAPPSGYGVSHVRNLHARSHDTGVSADFVVAKVTPQMISNLKYKIFIMFATVNIGAMATFS